MAEQKGVAVGRRRWQLIPDYGAIQVQHLSRAAKTVSSGGCDGAARGLGRLRTSSTVHATTSFGPTLRTTPSGDTSRSLLRAREVRTTPPAGTWWRWGDHFKFI